MTTISSIKFSVNMSNVEVPEVYLINNGRFGNMACNNFDVQDGYMDYLDLFHTYYMLRKGTPIAFRVVQILFGANQYFIEFADHTTEYIHFDSLADSKNWIFAGKYMVFFDKECLQKYIQTNDKSILYHDRMKKSDYIALYSSELKAHYIKEQIATKVGKLGYYTNHDLSVSSDTFAFACLWIDEYGIHYQLHDSMRYNPSGNKPMKDSESELNQLSDIVDFEDKEEEEDESEVFTIKIKVNKSKTMECMQLLLEEKFIQSLDDETLFFKDYRNDEEE